MRGRLGACADPCTTVLIDAVQSSLGREVYRQADRLEGPVAGV